MGNSKSRVRNNSSDWLGNIKNSCKLSSLSIPGTHDTMTYCLDGWIGTLASPWAKCQTSPLDDQLELGIRFLDLRVHHTDKDLPLYHGDIKLSINLKEVMKIITNFLSAHPSEVIIVNIQEYDAEVTTGHHYLRACAQEFAAFLFAPASDGSIPTLGETRGKIVLMLQRDGDVNQADSLPSLPWPDTDRVSNDWTPESYDVKKKEIEANMNKARTRKDGSLYLTFSSLSGLLDLGLPFAGALFMNPWLQNFVEKTSGRLGIIAMDFPSRELINAIVKHNY